MDLSGHQHVQLVRHGDLFFLGVRFADPAVPGSSLVAPAQPAPDMEAEGPPAQASAAAAAGPEDVETPRRRLSFELGPGSRERSARSDSLASLRRQGGRPMSSRLCREDLGAAFACRQVHRGPTR